MSQRNVITALSCIMFGGAMASLPYFMRTNTMNLNDKERLTVSQRQRGMYINVGSQDVGPDPNWDKVERRYNNYSSHPEPSQAQKDKWSARASEATSSGTSSETN